jgi:hypothetical protein
MPGREIGYRSAISTALRSQVLSFAPPLLTSGLRPPLARLAIPCSSFAICFVSTLLRVLIA